MNDFTIPALKGVAPFFAQFPRQRLLAVAAGFLLSGFFFLAPGLHEAGEARFPAAAPRERFTVEGSFAQQGRLSAVDPAASPFIPGSAPGGMFSRYKTAFVDTLLRAVERFRAGSFRTASPDPSWLPLLERLVEDGFERQDLDALFARLGSWSPAFMSAKVAEIHGVKGVSSSPEGEISAELPDGYEQPLSAVTVAEYRAFTAKFDKELKEIRRQFGLPSHVLIGLLLVETNLGSNLGSTPAMLALASMALTATPEQLLQGEHSGKFKRINPNRLAAVLKNKSAWAFEELKALIRYGLDNDVDVSKVPGSVYGAVGICQFMPSNIEAYGYDGDGDGSVNLFSVVDAMYSAANFLHQHGWRNAKGRHQQMKTLMAYNKDSRYARKVLKVADNLALAEKGRLAGHLNPMAYAGEASGRKTVSFPG